MIRKINRERELKNKHLRGQFMKTLEEQQHCNSSRQRFKKKKLRNYTDLSVELKMLWGLNNVKIVPVITGATGIIHNGLNDGVKGFELNTIKFEIREAQKSSATRNNTYCRSFFNIA